LDALNQVRMRNAQQILSALSEASGFRPLACPAGSSPIYLRLPLLAADRGLRDCALDRLRTAGIGASPYYPAAVCDIPGIEAHLASASAHCPVAENVASRILTLPTHPFVAPRDLARMAEILNASSREAAPVPVPAQTRAGTAMAGRE
jgi:dTDP-4-amino-4,6-dideoxygalactose transaminase